MNAQYLDGSYPAAHALRIPAACDIIPNDPDNWIVSPYKTNVRSEEFNRIFSTSTALNVLFEYKNYEINH
jgi:hypothetical protein